MEQIKYSEYKIIKDVSTGNLAEEVNKALLEGWQPLGGVVVNPGTERRQTSYIQTMVKPYEFTH